MTPRRVTPIGHSEVLQQEGKFILTTFRGRTFRSGPPSGRVNQGLVQMSSHCGGQQNPNGVAVRVACVGLRSHHFFSSRSVTAFWLGTSM